MSLAQKVLVLHAKNVIGCLATATVIASLITGLVKTV